MLYWHQFLPESAGSGSTPSSPADATDDDAAFRVRQKYNKTADLDKHSLTHYPFMPGCLGCEEGRLTCADMRFGMATVEPEPGKVLVLADYAGPVPVASNGSRWLLVLRFVLPGHPETQPFWLTGVKTRESDEFVVSHQPAREATMLPPGHDAPGHIRANVSDECI